MSSSARCIGLRDVAIEFVGADIIRPRAATWGGPYGMGKRMLCIVGADVLIRPGSYHLPPHQSRFARQLPP